MLQLGEARAEEDEERPGGWGGALVRLANVVVEEVAVDAREHAVHRAAVFGGLREVLASRRVCRIIRTPHLRAHTGKRVRSDARRWNEPQPHITQRKEAAAAMNDWIGLDGMDAECARTA